MSDPADVAELVARCIALRESEHAASIEEVCVEHPHLVDAVRQRIDALASMGLLDAEDTNRRRLGPFELLGRLGGGGMGEVHLARQDGLQRLVALKLVRPDHLHFAGARERFTREAEAVAQLKHPGIVPVYTVGEDDGVPYLAMECVEGATLDDVLRSVSGRDPSSLTGRDLKHAVERAVERLDATRGSTAHTPSSEGHGRSLFTGSWVEAVLRIGLAVTEALQHAHDHGILHRDVKPSNLMLTLDGRVLLLDFGLALREGSERITRSGALVGSLTYMAPEQVDGKQHAVDERVDVYGLGVTLYELLALRPPFVAESYDALRARILAGVTPSVRTSNASVGHDATTLLRVALAARPVDRYPSAADFGADVRRVLERRPLLAKPPHAGVRAWRWVQRHPARSVAVALGVLLVVGGPIGYALLAKRHADDMSVAADAANDAAAVAARESARALAAMQDTEEHFVLARQTIDDLLVEVEGVELFELPGMVDVRMRIVGRAVDAYDTLIAARPHDEALRLDRIKLTLSSATLLGTSGSLTEAIARYEEARSMIDQETERTPLETAPLDLIRYLVVSVSGAAAIEGARGHVLQAERLREEAHALLDFALERFPNDSELVAIAVETLTALAEQTGRSGRIEDADALFRRGLDLAKKRLADAPNDERVLRPRAWIGQSWVTHLAETQRWEECINAGLATLAISDHLNSLNASTVYSRAARHATWTQMGRALSALGAVEEADSMLAAAREACGDLAREHNDDEHLSTFYFTALNASAMHARTLGRRDDELSFNVTLEQAADDALAESPDLVEAAIARSTGAFAQALTLRSLERIDDALAAAKRAEDGLAALEGRIPHEHWTPRAHDTIELVGLLHGALDQHEAIDSAAARMIATEPEAPSPSTLQRAAFLTCCAINAAQRDGTLTSDQRAALRAQRVERAIAWLLRAAERSPHPASLRADSRWAPLWDHAAFAEIEAAFSGR